MISGVLGRLKEQPKKRFAAAGAGLGLLVTAPFGGLEQVSAADTVRTVKVAERVNLGPYAVTFDRAVAITQLEGVTEPSTEGNHLLVVLAHVRNPTDEWVFATNLAPIPKQVSNNHVFAVLDDALQPESAAVYHAPDATSLRYLNPGLDYEVALVWEYAGEVPEELNLGMYKLEQAPGLISPDVLEWKFPEPEAKITIPVVDKTAETAEPAP